ncbi:hypothetical protein ABZ820_33410 [Streptomyces diacarni]|uniref:hypothetical protein n=1 Tax=Streptomyces diacarni TaxID=2800381 RepID=UPI0033D4FB23
MKPPEIAQAITYANQIDPRLQITDPLVDVWVTGLSHVRADLAKWAIQKYYADANGDGKGSQPITPAAIRRLITAEASKRESQQRALEPPKNKAHKVSDFRKRNPELYDELYQQGREQFYADLKAKGINATPPWETSQAVVDDSGSSYAQGGGQ